MVQEVFDEGFPDEDSESEYDEEDIELVEESEDDED